MVTIKDVAERACVSVSTASRILSNSTREKFAPDTQARVLHASLELGYRPNFAARALVSGKTNIIAYIFPRRHDTPFTSLAMLQILAGVESYCSDNGYHLLISSPRIEDDQPDANFFNLLAGGYLDGAIIDGHSSISPVMVALQQSNIPAIVLGYHPHPYYLRGDNFLGGKLLMQHVLDLGHRRIGIIDVPYPTPRLDGMRAAAAEYDLDFASLPRVEALYSEVNGAEAAKKLLTNHPELTALVAWNDRMAMGAIRELQAMGYCIPQQISITGYDDLPQAHDLNITTINQQLAEWGTLAMNMLLSLLNGEEPQPIVIEPRLVVRQSTAPPPKIL